MPEPTTPTGTAPAVVALIRSLLYVVIIGALTALVTAITGADLSSIPAEWRPFAAAGLVIVARTLEGLVDQLRGQSPQAGPLGSAPATATAYIDTTINGASTGLPYALDAAIYGGEVTNDDLERVLASAARKLEQRNAAPPASPASSAS